MDRKPEVDILMPAFNAAPWLDDFMNSLLRQDFENWRLIVRDDGSRDETPQKLAEWQAKIGERMVVLADTRGNVGVLEGMTLLLSASKARWIMLADPDDVWLDGKMTRMAVEMREAEAACGDKTPIAICTDAAVVDERLRPIHASFWKSIWMSRPRRWSGRHVAVESPALSSTMILNRALADLALPIPSSAVYQDWWLAFVAASFGMLKSFAEPTVLYRRHGSNLSETAANTQLGPALFAALTGAMRPRVRSEVEKTSRQARAFVDRFGEALPRREAAAFSALADLAGRGGVAARLTVLRYGFWHSTLSRNLRLLAFL